MLNQLHRAISQACPIVGLADLGDGNYRIDFDESATEEQQAAAWEALASYKPELEPDWAGFRSSLLSSPAFLRIATATPLAQTFVAIVADLLWQLGDNPELLETVANAWAMIAGQSKPVAAEIAQINAVIERCHMPFHLDQSGMLIPGAIWKS